MNYTWIMSAITILTMWLAGSKNKYAWVLGLCNQLLWGYFIYDTRAYGLIPMTVAITFTYARNLYKWLKEV